MSLRRPVAWIPMVVAMAAGAALAGIMGWRVSLQGLERRISEKRGGIKKLTLSGGIPPNQEVMDYLKSRETSLEHRYQQRLKSVAVLPPAAAEGTDQQLYFQERFHEVQRTVERLATARTTPIPEALGFPKELPPSDTVPRLLVQLSLIQELAELIFGQGVGALASFKIEDPESLAAEDSEDAFLVRLPVRVRLTGTLAQTVKVLGAIDRVSPLIDVRTVRIMTTPTEGALDVELLVARYLAQNPVLETPTLPGDPGRAGQTKKAAPAAARGSPKETTADRGGVAAKAGLKAQDE